MREDLFKDAQSLLAGREGGVDRRFALKAALGVGYAAAAGSVMSQTAIKTSAEGLVAGEVMIDVNGFKMPAYRSMPAGKSNLPVVLVISEIFGVHEYIADVTRRLAHAGYMAIAPELFIRQGDPIEYGELAKLMSQLVSQVPDAQVMGDLDAAVTWAQTQGGDVSRLGITGFCWGGRITWLYAQHQAKLKAAVAWYGRLVGKTTPQNPWHPLDKAAEVKVPVLGLYGGADSGIPLDTIDKMKAALAAHGTPAARASEWRVYPEVPHAFHADYRPSYREAAAKDGWARMLKWFAGHGVI